MSCARKVDLWGPPKPLPTSNLWVQWQPTDKTRPKSAPRRLDGTSGAEKPPPVLANDCRHQISPAELIGALKMQAKEVMAQTGASWVVFVEINYREEARRESQHRNTYIPDHCAAKYHKYFADLKDAITNLCDAPTIVAATSYMPDMTQLGQAMYVNHSYQYAKGLIKKWGIDDEYAQLRLGRSRNENRTSSNASWDKAPLSREGAFEVHLFLDRSLTDDWSPATKASINSRDYVLLHSKLFSRHWPNVQNIAAKLKAMQPSPDPPAPPDIEDHIRRNIGAYCAGGYPWKFMRTRLPENRLSDRCESIFQKIAGCDRCGQEFSAGYRCSGGTHGVCSKCVYKYGCMFMA